MCPLLCARDDDRDKLDFENACCVAGAWVRIISEIEGATLLEGDGVGNGCGGGVGLRDSSEIDEELLLYKLISSLEDTGRRLDFVTVIFDACREEPGR